MVHMGNGDWEWVNKRWSGVTGVSASPTTSSASHTPSTHKLSVTLTRILTTQDSRARLQAVPSGMLGPLDA